MSAVVMVVGEGQLADFVCGELSVQYQVVRQTDWKAGVPKAADLALVLHDAWHPAVHQEAEEVLQPAGIPWLRGFVSFGEGVVGPLVRPGKPGCSQCADLRQLMAVATARRCGSCSRGWRHTGESRVTHGHRAPGFGR